MKNIHPQYYPEAKVKCICGNAWTTGSTLPEISVSICSSCHPFYTGSEKIVDTRGRVEKFRKRLEKVSLKKTIKKVAARKSRH
ncbi:MAG: 50S ribosomal protein L31 [Candidatus Yanofskybacteria bacterium RIFCSPLOWO2_12_FULL_44_13b]|uniref:Large ribosomal subunit protein bL31 n=1 Tax=Candidatus Yanofskybacteria bacterium RIFCSPLOWO2_02_FULL_44_18 TaxID=1802705 RepID=A0A1F8GZA7_9BACT|nr:MAG: 50S ribosomal protein L31 [Candidatus Yanofskybacteria bacterium RIFCSPHIGHO2_01_FULL_44_110b]OGN14630.1 MAG: 50S ribosomal protein L31 [Candidatus Yanofskybacteria bacterium RIFCSPHIGHO2_02_FULL_44_36b]OGN18700.1 MAG: 50S ribosomal protein L31 [Candidatus Yanofskybacteria bacterium RIFCSPHIGHO2_12_FULL_44_29b]OGN27236.1 MAG: 50S ribosomal protein L31 [Candidatus Yanofskybacteria bacterium RIFCSPLOWO2_01_FULL_44_88]OGN30737.1 MAG: 50S ribosomal protein L31 [Candidatus Yanofskybacteria b